jgi:predicted nucleic-acid-binding Zn-ribbon protein/peroxiredoxin
MGRLQNVAFNTIEAAMTPGSRAPDLELPGVNGAPIRLSLFWQDRPCILAFFGPLDSEFALEYALQLRDAYERFQQAGAQLAAVAPCARDEAIVFRQQHNIIYPMLCDTERDAYLAFGISSERPGTFVIDTHGTVRFAHHVASVLDEPSTWNLVDAACAITGATVDRPELALPELPDAAALEAVLPSKVIRDRLDYRCGKCGNQNYEMNTLSTAGGWLSRMFNFQYRKFSAITCTACGYTELYKTKSGALANVADILVGA